MGSQFDLVTYKAVFVETHFPERGYERVSQENDRFPLEKRLPFPYNDYLRFLEYIYDENEKPIGAKIECNHGSGYYGNYGKTVEMVMVGQTVEFTHNWTGVDDDGCPEDNCTDVKFQLVTHEDVVNE